MSVIKQNYFMAGHGTTKLHALFPKSWLTAYLQADNDPLQACSEKECHTFPSTCMTAKYRIFKDES